MWRIVFFDRRPVTSGVPRVLSAPLNDVDDNVINIVNRFVGDSKIGGRVDSEDLSSQQDLDQWRRWAKELQIKFNS